MWRLYATGKGTAALHILVSALHSQRSKNFQANMRLVPNSAFILRTDSPVFVAVVQTFYQWITVPIHPLRLFIASLRMRSDFCFRWVGIFQCRLFPFLETVFSLRKAQLPHKRGLTPPRCLCFHKESPLPPFLRISNP